MTETSLKPFDKRWLDKRGGYYTLITPEVAAELMSRNTNNRAIKKQKISQYAKDMEDGAWNADASELKFDRDGNLIDGQNRLMAAIQADVPFPTYVRTGLDPVAFNYIDTGAVRTTGDVFKRHGVTDYHAVASAVSLRARYEAVLAAGQTILEKRLPLTRHQALEYYQEHPSMELMTPLGRSIYTQAPSITRAVWIAGLSMMAEKDEDAARRFGASFIAGEPVPQLLALMRYAMSMTPAGNGLRYRNAGLRHLTALLKTWNAIREGRELMRLSIREDDKPVPAI